MFTFNQKPFSYNGQDAEVHLRDGLSDAALFHLIFEQQMFSISRLPQAQILSNFYSYAHQMGWTPLILDLGANIGMASLYYSMSWPQAHVCAVEPDKNNFESLQMNTRTRSNVTTYQAAISNKSGFVSIANPEADPCGFQTRSDPGGDIPAITVTDLLQNHSRQHRFLPFMIKIDIEGFEAELFASDYDWIDQFPLLVIELHDWCLPGQASSRNFLKAIAGRNRDFIYIGENIFSIKNDLAIPL